jgi:hypothetical protein
MGTFGASWLSIVAKKEIQSKKLVEKILPRKHILGQQSQHIRPLGSQPP